MNDNHFALGQKKYVMSHLFLIAQLVKSKWHIVFPLKIEGNGTLVSFSKPDAKPENHEFWARVASSSRGSFFRDFFRQTAFSITWINELNEGSDKKTRSINVKELFKTMNDVFEVFLFPWKLLHSIFILFLKLIFVKEKYLTQLRIYCISWDCRAQCTRERRQMQYAEKNFCIRWDEKWLFPF